jgi:hypothetical protein
MAEPSRVYTDLRDIFFEVTPESTQATDELPRVYGAVVDIGFEPLFTIATYAGGTTNACDSNGGGVNDLGQIAEVVVLGRAVLRAAEANLAMFEPVESPPLPAFGRVRFTALAHGGKLGVELDGSALLKGQSPLSAAFTAVMAIVELARRKAAEGGPAQA